MSAGRVLSLSSIVVDLPIDVPTVPDRGGDVLGVAREPVAGGGFNVVAAAARQGVACVYAGPHGTGRHGDVVRAALAADGVTAALPVRTDADTGFCVTLVEPDGERTFVTAPGVEADLRPGDLAGLVPGPGDVVVLSGYDLVHPGNGPVVERWTGNLPADARVVLDPGPLVRDIPRRRFAAVGARVSVLTVNQREARLLGRDATATGAALVAAVRRHPAVGPGTAVVVREGATGATAWGDGRLHVAVAPRVVAVDTTGAGDTHTGVLAALLAEGADLTDALVAATAAATDSVTRAGPATAPHRRSARPQP